MREKEGEGGIEYVARHLGALVLGHISCFDMSHNLWESVGGISSTHADRAKEQPAGCERMWERQREGMQGYLRKALLLWAGRGARLR